MLFLQEIAKRKDGSEERRLNFPLNAQAVSNDTSSLENGQEESAVSVVSSKVSKLLLRHCCFFFDPDPMMR
jgi:hypothetical protein